MPHPVTERFVHCLRQLIDRQVIKSYRQFALALDYSPQGISEIVNQRRDVTLDLLHRAVAEYRLSPEYLLCGVGEPFTAHNGTVVAASAHSAEQWNHELGVLHQRLHETLAQVEALQQQLLLTAAEQPTVPPRD